MTTCVKFTKDNLCYMCPKCLHLFFQKNDMTRHIKRKTPCKQAYICSLSGSEILRKSHNRYYFHGVTKFPLLSTSQKINMLTQYDGELNMIYDTSLLISSNKSLPLERHIKSNMAISSDGLRSTSTFGPGPKKVGLDQSTDDDLRCNLLDLKSPKKVDQLPSDMTTCAPTELMTPCYSMLDKVEPTEVSLIPSDISQEQTKYIDQKQLFTENITVVNGVTKYQCKMCKYIFSCKRNLIRHLDRKNSCNHQSKIRELTTELSIVKTLDSISDKINTVKSITTSDGVSKIALRNFVNDHYDYSHIDKNLALQVEIFDPYVFLSTLFSNNVNKNVFFDDRYGYFYVEGKIERAPKEKVGYVLMEKLSATVTSFIKTNPLINQEDYSHIIKFYSVETFKYCFDTYYRPYDMVKREYIFNNVMMLRTRDHYLGDFVRAINYYKDWTLLLMGVKFLDDLHITYNYNLDIPEKYQAVQHRYSNPKYAYYY